LDLGLLQTHLVGEAAPEVDLGVHHGGGGLLQAQIVGEADRGGGGLLQARLFGKVAPEAD
jgi:hypothetical protein